jgi:hypothetical protein
VECHRFTLQVVTLMNVHGFPVLGGVGAEHIACTLEWMLVACKGCFFGDAKAWSRKLRFMPKELQFIDFIASIAVTARN